MELTYHDLLSIVTLVVHRLAEIERLQAQHPDLPIADPQIVGQYQSLLARTKDELAAREAVAS